MTVASVFSWGCSISVPSRLAPLASKCAAVPPKKSFHSKRLPEIHQIGAVIRSGEYRPSETASRPLGAGPGAQPHPHNPRKQRENPAAAGSGECFLKGKWRTGWDSNPRDGSPPTHFPGVRLRPLGHPSEAELYRQLREVARGLRPRPTPAATVFSRKAGMIAAASDGRARYHRPHPRGEVSAPPNPGSPEK